MARLACFSEGEFRVPPSSESTNRPLVSVCLTHHERPAYLDIAVESLLVQDYSNFEVLLVDDGSRSEGARDALARLEPVFQSRGWRILRQENRYLGAARNAAARAARGEYLLFMDDDNVAKPQEISTFVRIAENTQADIVTCLIDMFPGEGQPEPGSPSNCRWLIAGLASYLGIVKNCFGDANALVRRTSFEALGGFTEDYGVGHEDWEFFARACLNGMRLELIPDALFWYRFNETSMVRSTAKLPNYQRSLRPFLEQCPAELQEVMRMAQGQALHVRELYDQIDLLATKLGLLEQHASQLEFQLMRRELHLQQARYRFADKLNQGLKRLPAAHDLARRLLRSKEEW
ncbi:MAG: glycosyltransferase family A protein [Planctomycetota bacterium]